MYSYNGVGSFAKHFLAQFISTQGHSVQSAHIRMVMGKHMPVIRKVEEQVAKHLLGKIKFQNMDP